MKFEIELVGHFAGKTVVLNGLQYVDGVATIKGEATAMASLMEYHRKCYQAYLVGSADLAAAKARLENKEPEADGISADIQGSEREVESGARSDIEPAAVELDGSGSDEAPATGSGPVSEGSRGESGSDGEHESSDATSSGEPTEAVVEPTEPQAPVNKKLADAVMKLDYGNNDHWTDGGLPAMKAVESAYGATGITRADVEDAMPEWNRESAEELATM
jgi:hypothetical protein